jgi:hypothetical protein
MRSRRATRRRVISRDGRTPPTWVIAARYGSGAKPVTISGLPSTVTSGAVYTEGRSLSAARDADRARA